MPDRTAKPQIVLGSRNRNKIAEIINLLAPHNIEVASLADFGDVPEVLEEGSTFAENAAQKAGQTAQFLKKWVLAEDSGLMVDAIGGRPGVYSARFSGQAADDEKNNRKLLSELAETPPEKRTAAYVCSVAVADPTGVIRLRSEESCRGRITVHPRGTNGFGYDPLFLISEYHRTFGELSPMVKQQLSHRARALRRLVPQLVGLLSREANVAENHTS